MLQSCKRQTLKHHLQQQHHTGLILQTVTFGFMQLREHQFALQRHLFTHTHEGRVVKNLKTGTHFVQRFQLERITNAYQLFFQVDGPNHSVMTHCENNEQQQCQLSIAHFPHSPVVEYGLSPIWQPIDQNTVIPTVATGEKTPQTFIKWF